MNFSKRHLSLLVTFFSLASHGVFSDEQSANNSEVSIISRYEALTKEYPDQAEPFYQLGRAYSQAQEWDKSIIALNRALELQPDNSDISLALAYADLWRYLSQSKLLESEKLFQQVLQAVPTYTDATAGLKRITDIREAQNRGDPLDLSQDVTPCETLAQAYKDVIRYEQLTQEHPDQAESFYQLGRAYTQTKAWYKSLRALRRALQLQPDNPDIRLALAYTLLFEYMSKQDVIESQELFRLVLRAVPTYTDAQNGLNRIDSLLHPQPKETAPAPAAAAATPANQVLLDIARYEALAKEHPDQVEPFYQLGRAYAQIQEWDKAILALNRALELQPNNPDVRLALAYTDMWHYLSQSRLRESEELFQQVLQAVPTYADATAGLKRIAETQEAMSRGDMLEVPQETTTCETLVQAYKDVIRYEPLTQEHPDQAEAFYQLGRAYAQAKAWYKSIRALRRALELQPDNPDIRLALAYTLLFEYLSKAELIESQELFDLVLLAVPTYTEAQEGLKQLHRFFRPPSEEGQRTPPAPVSEEKKAETPATAPATEATPSSEQEAVVIARYESLIKEDPDQSEYFYQLGRAYSQAQAWDKSIATLNRALELKTDNQDARLALAYAHLQRYTSKSNLLKSKHLFQQVLQAIPNYIDAQGGLKQVENLLQPPKEAESEKKKSFHFLERQLGTPSSTLANATIQRLSNISYYESLAQENPDQPGYFYQLGRAYSQAQEWNQSINAFNRALELQPNNQDVRLALAYSLLFEYRSKQDLIESEELFKQVLAAVPSYRDAQVGLAQVAILLHPSQEEAFIEKKNLTICLKDK